MRITLTNFLCYENKVFDFNEKQLTLIEGPSGKGKSTIMRAILFALFGTGTKLPTYGKTSCKVVLEFNSLKIERTKRPNVLKVNDEHEDKVGQDIINRIFGEYFQNTSYIPQNITTNFILKSSTEKLEFLESFAFKDDNIDDIKQKLNKIIKKDNEEIIKLESKIELLEQQFSEKELPEKIKFPIKCKRSDVDKITSEYIEKYIQLINSIEKLEIDIEKLKQKSSEKNILLQSINHTEQNIKELNERNHELTLRLDKLSYKGESFIQNIEAKIKTINDGKKYNLLESKLNEKLNEYKSYKLKEQSKLDNKISKIKEELWKEYDKNELNEMLQDYKKLIKDRRQLDKLLDNKRDKGTTKNIDDLKDQKNELISNIESWKDINSKYEMCKNVYSCPSCNIHLKFANNKLLKFEDKVQLDFVDSDKISDAEDEYSKLISNITIETKKSEDLISINKQIESIESQYDSIPSEENICESIAYLKQYNKDMLNLENELNTLELPQYINDMENEIEIIKNKLSVFSKPEKIDDSEEHLLEILYKQKSERDSYNTIKSDIDLINKKLEHLKLQQEHNNKNYTEFKNILFDDEITNSINKKQCLTKESDNIKSINNTIEKWHKYQAEKTVYDKELDTINESNKLKKEYELKYGAALKLKNMILSTESAIMSDILDNINIQAKTYLDIFFPEDPISIHLLPFKEKKGGVMTPSINLSIEYKGMECEIGMLSGGELSRVIVAYTLALNEIFNSPLILLDECTSSLDQETTNTVFDAIKEHCIDKTVLIIAHQVVNGGFDNLIQL